MSQGNFLTASDFTRLVFNRLKKFLYLIIITAIICGSLLGIYAANSPVIYTSRAIIFSLNSSSDNPGASSAISMLLGSDAGKSFSDETSVNIIELAQSRAISEAVASMPVPSMGNKIVAALLIDSINSHRGLLQKKLIIPKDRDKLINLSITLLQAGLSTTINRNNSFILSFSGKSEEMVKIISYAFIDKISQFYIDLKREKAKRDYEFASEKVDSLRRAMGAKDYTLIAMDRRTLFTNTDKLEYRMPSENLLQDKQLLRGQYSQAVVNQQTAAYKLQKDTPVIKILDKPDPPYDTRKKSIILYSLIGILIGGLSISGLVTLRLFLRFTGQEVSRALFGSSLSKNTTTTTASAL